MRRPWQLRIIGGERVLFDADGMELARVNRDHPDAVRVSRILAVAADAVDACRSAKDSHHASYRVMDLLGEICVPNDRRERV